MVDGSADSLAASCERQCDVPRLQRKDVQMRHSNRIWEDSRCAGRLVGGWVTPQDVCLQFVPIISLVHIFVDDTLIVVSVADQEVRENLRGGYQAGQLCEPSIDIYLKKFIS